ncbi:hypothetical protein GF362_02425 [Candidatus Dojkabacteria bacterium]|nr:hypothetical protein [Candidatus Dojkabacteria bacterium]
MKVRQLTKSAQGKKVNYVGLFSIIAIVAVSATLLSLRLASHQDQQGTESEASATQESYPWTDNGPKSVWVGSVGNIATIINGDAGWKFKQKEKLWEKNGEPFTLKQSGWWNKEIKKDGTSDPGKTEGFGAEPYEGTYPWTNGGPTCAWTSPKNKKISVCNGEICWQWDEAKSNWSRNGSAVKISESGTWNRKIKKDGTDDPNETEGIGIRPFNHGNYIDFKPWSDGGPTSAWTNDKDNLITVCNKEVCWTWDEVANDWYDDGKAYQISKSGYWNKKIKKNGEDDPNESEGFGVNPLDGIYPWSDSGPTSAWENYVDKLISICNGNVCWQWDVENEKWNNGGTPVKLSDSGWWNKEIKKDGTPDPNKTEGFGVEPYTGSSGGGSGGASNAADLTGDGNVNISDFGYFVDKYKSGDDSKIDFDGDGEYKKDLNDFTQFAPLYIEGVEN